MLLERTDLARPATLARRDWTVEFRILETAAEECANCGSTSRHEGDTGVGGEGCRSERTERAQRVAGNRGLFGVLCELADDQPAQVRKRGAPGDELGKFDGELPGIGAAVLGIVVGL